MRVGEYFQLYTFQLPLWVLKTKVTEKRERKKMCSQEVLISVDEISAPNSLIYISLKMDENPNLFVFYWMTLFLILPIFFVIILLNTIILMLFLNLLFLSVRRWVHLLISCFQFPALPLPLVSNNSPFSSLILCIMYLSAVLLYLCWILF